MTKPVSTAVASAFGAWAVMAAPACAPRSTAPASASEAPVWVSPRAAPTTTAAPLVAAAPVASAVPSASTAKGAEGAKGDKLTLAEARRYMVSLINRDRATAGLAPVELDEGAATRAGQGHADDMAGHGFFGHFGTDGRSPEQRHTEAGGVDVMLENASCVFDEKPRMLDRDARFDPRDLEAAEALFFNEVPPNDGHRQNILKPYHRRVGIGLAQAMVTAKEVPPPCVTEELVDAYGTYAAVPAKAKVGDVIHVEGTIAPPAVVAGVGLARVAMPLPLSVAEANKRRTAAIPAPYQMYWPKGFVTPIPLQVDGSAFRIDVPLSDRGEPGLYELSVWAKIPGAPGNVIVGLRTIVVGAKR